MRAIAWSCLAACGGTAGVPPSPGVRPAPAHSPDAPDPDAPRIDPLVALTPDDEAELSWVIPGPIQLELGGSALPSGGSGRPIEVAAFDRQGKLERVAVRLEHARFSVWIGRAQMLSVVRRDHRLGVPGVPAVGGEVEVVLRAGAVVRRLAHREHATRVRYLGVLQVEGWVPDAVLGERGPARSAAAGGLVRGHPPLMVIPGAVIRAEPRWAAGELATVATPGLLGSIRAVDAAWNEVAYEDREVRVHGFVSRRDPPGRVHHWRETDGTPTIQPNATVASGTCLHARANGDAIGYIVGNRPAELEDAGGGWWTLAIDTPWGPLGFAARGPTAGELAACAPPSTVPPPTAAP